MKVRDTASVVLTIALRLYPPVSPIHPRVTPPDGMMVAGQFILGNVKPFLSSLTVDCREL